MKITKSYLKELVYQVVGASIEVHKALGPGLLKSVYQKCLEHELRIRNIDFVSEATVPVNFKGLEMRTKLRCDLLVEDTLVVELKSVKEMEPIFEAQLLTYMKLLKSPKGILINFNVENIYKEGQKTYVNEYFYRLAE